MPRTFHELRHTNGNNIEAMVMYGLTDKQPDELTSLNRSWNFAPAVTDYQSGIEVDADGSYTLVLWLPLSTTETVSIVGVRK